VVSKGRQQPFAARLAEELAATSQRLAASREAQTAAHLADHVIPPVPVRQWVISVPKRLRGMLADRPAAVNALTKIFLDEIERLLCAAAGVTDAVNTPTAACPRLGAGPHDRSRSLIWPRSPSGYGAA
jgi:hypothetical protein